MKGQYLRLLKKSSAKGVLTIVRCLTKREITCGAIDYRIPDLEIKSGVWKINIDGFSALGLIAHNKGEACVLLHQSAV